MIGPLLKQEIESSFEIIRARCTPTELVFICPEPGCNDQSGNRSVNLTTGKTSCWRCSVGGSFIWWAKRLGYSFSTARDVTGIADLRDMFKTTAEDRSILPAVATVPLPSGFIRLRDEPKSVYTRLIGEMAVRKNLTLKAFVDTGAGFTRTNHLWEPYCIFPVTEYGQIVYYQGRTYAEEPGDRTKRFPSREVVPHGAKYWIYNIDELHRTKCEFVIVVESILNVLSLREFFREIGYTQAVPVAVFKHRISMEQFYKLSRFEHIKEVCLLFDRDAIHDSWQDAAKFTHRCKVTVAEMPSSADNKRLDPNDDVQAAWEALQKRQPYSSYHRLYGHKAMQTGSAEQTMLVGMRFE